MLVRRDLPLTQIAVQAVHAGIEAARQFLPAGADHPYLVLCAVDSEQHLLAAADRLYTHDVKHVLFREPDRGDEVTALATEPLSCPGRRAVLSRYRCLQPSDLFSSHKGGGLP